MRQELYPNKQAPQISTRERTMTLSAIVIGLNLKEIAFTLKSFSGTRGYIDEIIVVHSCQNFDVKEVLDNTLDYPIIRAFETERLGICAAFNYGLNMSTSEHVVYVNSGDELIIEGLISATQMLSTCPAVISSAVSIYSPTLNSSTLWTGLDSKSRITQIHQQGTIYKKSLHEIHGTYSSLFKCAMDTAFFDSVLSSKTNYRILYNPSPVVKFYTGGISYANKHLTVLEYSLIRTLGSKSPIRNFFLSLPLLSIKLLALKIKKLVNLLPTLSN